MTEKQQMKQRAIAILSEKLASEEALCRLSKIDDRVLSYFEDLRDHSGVELGDENDWHNLWEILGAIKFLRILETYPFDYERVRRIIYMREGDWHKEGKKWVHDGGGLKVPSTRGSQVFRWLPYQTLILASIFGPHAWIDTQVENGTRDLLPTEREGEGGTIEDYRQLCTDYTLFAPRKVDKTGISAYISMIYFMEGDENSEIADCANSADQAKILYKRTQDLIRQVDPRERNIRFTAKETNWLPRNITGRSAVLMALSAGAKTKDGLFAQLCCRDEFGSAGYVKGHSDMGALVNTIDSSMGPRREPMDVTTTTAGTIQSGPFKDRLDVLLNELEEEIAYFEGSKQPTLDSDRWLGLFLRPDMWETDEEFLFASKTIRKKINPGLGIIVQHAFYDKEIAETLRDVSKKGETTAKLFNLYSTDRVSDWIRPTEVRDLQQSVRPEELTKSKGWMCFCGIDVAGANADGSALGDLYAHTYFFVNTVERGEHGEPKTFACMDAWISEESVKQSPNEELLRKWASEGWLHIVTGKVVEPSVPVNRIAHLAGLVPDESGQLPQDAVLFTAFLYDPYSARIPINDLSAWVYSQGADPSQIVIPCRQNFATFSGPCGELEYMIRAKNPWIHFSDSPLWPWEAGGMYLAESTDGMGNKKPVKKSEHTKIDNWIALLMAIHGWDIYEGKVQPSDS